MLVAEVESVQIVRVGLAVGFVGLWSARAGAQPVAPGDVAPPGEPPPSAEVAPAAEPAPVAEAPPPAPAPPPPRPIAAEKPLGPAVFFTGVGLTVVGAGATAVSAIDASHGTGGSGRTYALLGATGGVAVATAVIGAFFTQWSSPVQPTVALGPDVRGAGISGRF